VKIAWLTDSHGIFVDRHAWHLALNLVAEFKPTHLPVGSDDVDFYTLSRFDKDPDRKDTLQNELDFQYDRYQELRDAGGAIEYPTVLGNHNERLMKSLWRDPKWSSLRAVEYPNLLAYETFGFSWAGNSRDYLTNREWWATPNLVFTHGEKASLHPGYSVKNQMAARFYDASLVMGHCHRGALSYLTKPNGVMVFGVEGYCLCQLHPEYAPITNWTQGVVFITIHPTGISEVEMIPFVRSDGRLHAYWRHADYSVSLSRTF